MKRHHLNLAISTTAASLLTFTVLAQDPASYRTNRSDHSTYTRDASSPSDRMEQLQGVARISDFIGMTVNNPQDKKLGSIHDLAVDLESGRILQMILATGGLLGFGETLTAVPPGALHYDATKKVLHLQATAASLKAAPTVDMDRWAECCTSNRVAAVYALYGQESALSQITMGDAEGQSNLKSGSATTEHGHADAHTTSSRMSASRFAQAQPASKLIGTPVHNLQDQNLGNVEDLVADLSAGRLVAVVISSGGFLGMGDTLSAVPPTALRYSNDRAHLQLDASKESLSNAPHFKSNQWPDFSQPNYSSSVYESYKVQPYFSNETTVDPDNSRLNVRDRDDRSLTPFDQGNSSSDIDITASIRRAIRDGDNLSVNANNVKIITKDGRVTLRGPVNTAEEKQFIGDTAQRLAGSGKVENFLEITPTDNGNK